MQRRVFAGQASRRSRSLGFPPGPLVQISATLDRKPTQNRSPRSAAFLRSLVPIIVIAFLLIAPPSAQPAVPKDATEAVQQRFQQLDRNRDGRLTAAELKSPALFKLLDRDADGSISRDEARRAG